MNIDFYYRDKKIICWKYHTKNISQSNRLYNTLVEDGAFWRSSRYVWLWKINKKLYLKQLLLIKLKILDINNMWENEIYQ